MSTWLELPIKNATVLFFASQGLSHIKDCRQCSYQVLILTSIRLKYYIHFLFLFKKQRQMERASEVPFQRLGLKQILRSLQTVMKNWGKNSSLQPWTACCMKKKSSRYESELSGLPLTQTHFHTFSVEHELLSGLFYFQWLCHLMSFTCWAVQMDCSLLVIFETVWPMPFRCWAKRAEVLCPKDQPHMEGLDAFRHLWYHEACVLATEWCPKNHPMECQDEIPLERILNVT